MQGMSISTSPSPCLQCQERSQLKLEERCAADLLRPGKISGRAKELLRK